MTSVLRFYQRPGLTPGRLRDKQRLIQRSFPSLLHIDSEYCFNVGISGNDPQREREETSFLPFPNVSPHELIQCNDFKDTWANVKTTSCSGFLRTASSARWNKRILSWGTPLLIQETNARFWSKWGRVWTSAQHSLRMLSQSAGHLLCRTKYTGSRGQLFTCWSSRWVLLLEPLQASWSCPYFSSFCSLDNTET